MKTMQKILWFLGVFYAIITVVYIAMGIMLDGKVEWAGAMVFALLIFFSSFLAVYMGLVRKIYKDAPLPEDSDVAESSDAEPDFGFFAPHSIWPVASALSAASLLATFAFGFWLGFFILPFVLVCLVGWVYEFYTGRFVS